MAIGHIIFNKLKWFNVTNAESQIINGKQYFTFPPKIRSNNMVNVGAINGNCSIYSNDTFNVIGASEKYYVAHGRVIYAGGAEGNEDFLIKKSDCTPIWGGKNFLIHVYHTITSLFKKAVTAW